jgi:hypothetical protein
MVPEMSRNTTATLLSIIIGFSLLFFNCQGDDGASKNILHSASADVSSIQGEWSSGCNPDPQKTGFFFEDTRAFSEDSFKTAFDTFSDKDCRNLIISRSQGGIFNVVPEDEESENHPGKLNLTVKSIIITIMSPKLVNLYNQKKICGANWQTGVGKKITKSECTSSDENPESEDLIFDIFQVIESENQDHSLVFGLKNTDATEGKSEATRPTSVDAIKRFSRL